jgi:hypothetical protein
MIAHYYTKEIAEVSTIISIGKESIKLEGRLCNLISH